MTNTSRPALLGIAKRHLRLDTLDDRKSDALDFSDQAVWNIRYALEAAYEAGRQAALAERDAALNAATVQAHQDHAQLQRLNWARKPSCWADVTTTTQTLIDRTIPGGLRTFSETEVFGHPNAPINKDFKGTFGGATEIPDLFWIERGGKRYLIRTAGARYARYVTRAA